MTMGVSIIETFSLGFWITEARSCKFFQTLTNCRKLIIRFVGRAPQQTISNLAYKTRLIQAFFLVYQNLTALFISVPLVKCQKVSQKIIAH
jgi:hypothetical protein